MKFFRIDLLTLLISLFILNSCKNENLVGLAPGSSPLSGSLDDTATVYTNTVAEDTIATTGMAKLPLGYLIDPVLGTTESDMITNLNLPFSSSYTVPTGTITIDSALLVLKYADGYYGGDTLLTNYTVNVYQLAERMYSGKEYYDNKRWMYNPNIVIGDTTFLAKPHTPVKVDTIVHGGKDTLVTDPAAIRIPLSKSFIQSTFFGAGLTTLNSNLIFENNAKGFFITINKNNITGTGGTLMFQPPTTGSVAIYYRAINGSTVDTSIIALDITQHATQVNHVFSAQVQSALALTASNTANNTTIPDNYIYLQSGGLKSKITFPYLQSLFNSIPGGKNNVVINRAELVVTDATAVQGDIPAYLVPSPKLTLYRYDITHQAFTVEDATSGYRVFFGVPEFGGYYNNIVNSASIGTYHFLITSYLQNIINGTTVDYGTFIAPVDTTNTTSVDIAPTLQTSARTIAVGGANKAATGSIKLNVIYTKTR